MSPTESLAYEGVEVNIYDICLYAIYIQYEEKYVVKRG